MRNLSLDGTMICGECISVIASALRMRRPPNEPSPSWNSIQVARSATDDWIAPAGAVLARVVSRVVSRWMPPIIACPEA